MKWLPPPSVPSWCTQLECLLQRLSIPGCFSKILVSCFWNRFAASRARLAVGVLAEADRHVAADLREELLQRGFVELVCAERHARGHHAAADIDADRGGDDRLPRRDHRSDRGADAEVDVGHRRHVVVHDRQAREVDELLARRGSRSRV